MLVFVYQLSWLLLAWSREERELNLQSHERTSTGTSLCPISQIAEGHSLKWWGSPLLTQKAVLFPTTCNWNVAFITMVCAPALPEAKVVICSPCFCSLAVSQASFICTTFRYLHYIWHDSPPLLIISLGPKTCCTLVSPSTDQAQSMLKGYCKVHRAKGKIELALWINRNSQPSDFWIKIRGLKRL